MYCLCRLCCSVYCLCRLCCSMYCLCRLCCSVYCLCQLCCSMYCLCRLFCSMYCLYVNVYCTTATGWQTNFSLLYICIFALELISSINFSMIFLFEYISIPASGYIYNHVELCSVYLLLSWIFTFPLTDVWSRLITVGEQHAILRLPNYVRPARLIFLPVSLGASAVPDSRSVAWTTTLITNTPIL